MKKSLLGIVLVLAGTHLIMAAQLTKVAVEDMSVGTYWEHGNEYVLWIGNADYAGEVKSYVKFSVPELTAPSGQKVSINSATFTWVCGDEGEEPGNTPPTATLYQVADNSWTETSGLTVYTSPAFGPAISTFNFIHYYVPMYFNVTNYLQAVVDNGSTIFSLGANAPMVYVDGSHRNCFRMFSREAESGYPGHPEYRPTLTVNYTIGPAPVQPPEVDIANVPVVYPSEGSMTTPITHQPYFQGERELFGYHPRFTPSDVTFDPDNRPYIRVGEYANGHDMFGDDNVSLGVIQTTDDAGNWIELNTFLPAIKRKYLGWNGVYSSGIAYDERIVFDSSGDAYMVVHTYRSNLGLNVLLYSKDRCRTWTVYPLSPTYFFAKWELPDGHNDTNNPPALLVWTYGGGPISLITPRKTDGGGLTLPVVTLAAAATAQPMGVQSGMGNSTVAKGNLIHAVYFDLNTSSISGYSHGTPQYVVTYNRDTGTVGAPVLLGLTNTLGPANNHDGPAIAVDSQGYLHVIFGAHSANLRYTRSLAPNSSTSGWTAPINIGTPSETNGMTYVSLICDQNDTLHVVGRNDNTGDYRFCIWYLRKTAGGNWQDLGPLVRPFRSYYSNWYHRLSLDRQNRLFLKYMYYGDQYDRGTGTSDEINGYRGKWPWEQPCLIDSVNTSWGGIQGHDPCMILSDDGGNSWRIALTTSLQLFFNNSFDNGLDGWALTQGFGTNSIRTMTSYTYNGKTITPRRGPTMAVSEQAASGKRARRTIQPARAGVVTGYMNMVENTDVGMVSVCTPGHEFVIMANSTAGKVSYRIDAATTATAIDVTPQAWHEVKFVAGPGGINGFWDGTLLFHSDLGSAISAIDFGSAWTTAPCGYDDFSFVPIVSGDVNYDGLINSADLAVLLSAMDAKSGDGNWNALADLDNNGEVTSTDLSILLANWN